MKSPFKDYETAYDSERQFRGDLLRVLWVIAFWLAISGISNLIATVTFLNAK